jgi:DNA processing protein
MRTFPVHDEFASCLVLTHTPGLGARTWKVLLEQFGSAGNALLEIRSWVGRGLVRAKIVELVEQGAWQNSADEEYRRVAERGDLVVCWNDEMYPPALREIPDPPLYLYALGHPGLLKGHCVAMVGARRCSRYGQQMASVLSRDLSGSGITVVSGFASGIDRQAHGAAIDGPGSSIAVLGTGLDLIYPAGNRDLWAQLAQNGLILTEFPPGTKPEAPNFPRRNRIISGICLGVVVIEAEQKSGSLITARLAMEQGREVFALPGPVNLRSFDGCHQLIREGAVLVRHAEDVLTELAPRLSCRGGSDPRVPARIEASLQEEEQQIVDIISEQEQAHIDHIARRLGVESAYISQALLMLELKQVVTKLPGMYYRLAV